MKPKELHNKPEIEYVKPIKSSFDTSNPFVNSLKKVINKREHMKSQDFIEVAT